MSSGGTATAAAAAAAKAGNTSSDPFCFDIRLALEKSPCALAESKKAYTAEVTGVTGAPDKPMVRESAQSLVVTSNMSEQTDLAGLLGTELFLWNNDPLLGGGAKDQGLFSSLGNCSPAMMSKEIIAAIMAAPSLTLVNKKTLWKLCQACVAYKVQSEQRRPKAST